MFSSERKLIIFVGLCCLVLALLGYAWKQRTIIPYVTEPLENITAPFTYGNARVLANLRTGIAVIDNALDKFNELETLKAENAQLVQKQVSYEELAAENMRLRQLLQFKNKHPQFEVMVAQVITRDLGDWTYTLTIDRGRAEGVSENMAVVVPSGVVGFVSDVYEHSARVQTMLDSRTSIGGIVQRPESRVASIIKGNGNQARYPIMVNIAKDADVLSGDTIVTSGYGGIYPKGLLIGHVTDLTMDPEGFVKNGIIQPAANFDTLEEVLIIRRSEESQPAKPTLEPRLVPQTQRDQVEGAKGAVKQ